MILYSALLLAIVNLKLSIHHLRKSDIYLLHKEYYFSCMAERSVSLSLKRLISLSRKHLSLSPSNVYLSIFPSLKGLARVSASKARCMPLATEAESQESVLHSALHACKVSLFMSQSSVCVCLKVCACLYTPRRWVGATQSLNGFCFYG